MDVFIKVKRKRNQFILSFLSAIVYLLGYSIIMESGNFSVYFLSYIHYNQNWVDMQYGNLMRPVVLLFLSLFSPLSGMMENLVGPRFALLISCIVIEITLFFFYFQQNLWLFYLLSLFLGLGCGLSASINVKNCCCFYPKKKGFINACIMSLGALIGSSYTLLGEKLINPDRKEVIDIDNEPYYTLEISERSKYFFLFGMIIMPLSTSISIFLFYKYDPSCETENGGEEKIDNKIDEIKGPLLEGNNKDNKEENKEKENKETVEDENKKDEKINVSNSFGKPTSKGNIKKALKNLRFWRNILISGVMPFGLFFILSTSRAYSALLGVDGNIVGTLAGTMNIIGSTCNPIWAFCTDKFGFQPVMKTLSIFIIIFSVYFFIFMGNKLFYVIGLYISCTFRGGVISCITPHIMHIFGLRYYLTLGGFGRLFNQLVSFLIAMISIIISIWNKTYEELFWPYRIISAIGFVIAICGFILVFFENEEKFKFDDEEEEEKETLGKEEKVENNNKKEETKTEKKEENKEQENKKDEDEKNNENKNEEINENIKEEEIKKEENEEKKEEPIEINLNKDVIESQDE